MGAAPVIHESQRIALDVKSATVRLRQLLIVAGQVLSRAG